MSSAHDKPEWAQSRREKRNAERVAQGLKPRRRIWPWIVLLLIVAAVVAFIFLNPAPAPVETAAAEEAAIVRQIRQSETITMAPATLSETVKVTGTLVPAQLSDVASQASGRVMAVLVRPGDTVNEGDVLAQIDRATLELQLSQQRATASATRAQFESSQQQLERTEQLATQGLASPSVLEQARSATAALQAQLDALQTGVETAELALDNATVTSPLSGVVASRSVEPGQTIQAGTPLFNVVNLEEMEFQAAASVNSSALVNAGQTATVTVTGLEGQQFTGQVSRVNPVALTGTRTVPIYIELDNSEGALRGGMFATGNITVMEQADAMAIPSSALREDAEGQFVLMLEGETLARKPVETVREWNRGSLVEVTGLAAGDVVVSAALTELQPGDRFSLLEG
ncbi:efflux RND transporter periplasmic adaptor subunit [Devosia rhizoryzae]|uniref:Efflux RND transporter periplasmic adaptor subunit n=1 Tax=Devosia rhizoryzae TaxID=2774137 RepID=A0ABX7C654_9HYPH|nr:efflux RND transporter periplasmic adaptor subunit [Devosia rhizoryzae]QQR39724.1 efflux RND transporter periplasmic adaptor subunit [Devosia rhizoryzae]